MPTPTVQTPMDYEHTRMYCMYKILYILLSVVVVSRSLLLAVYCRVSAVALQRKFHLYIPFLGIARPQSRFPHLCVCE
jgi:hypothetical protein